MNVGHGLLSKSRKHLITSVWAFTFTKPRVLKHIEPGEYLDFPDLVLRLLDNGEKVSAYPGRGLWLDIGRPDDYARAQELFAQEKGRFEHV